MKADPKDNKIVFLNRFNKYLFDKNSISMSLVKARIKKIIKKINVNIIHGNEIYFHNLKFCIIALVCSPRSGAPLDFSVLLFYNLIGIPIASSRLIAAKIY